MSVEGTVAGGRGQELYRKAKSLIPGGTQLLSKRPEMFLPDQWPSYYRSAAGATVRDLEDRELTDMSISGVGACPLGFADPDVNAAVIEAVGLGTMATLNCPEEVALAELLCEIHPWADMCRFTRTGGEAMAVAVRIARARTRRSLVAFCGYHGWSDWYLAANRSPADALGAAGLLLPGLEPTGVPAELAGTAVTFRHNDPQGLRELATAHGGQLAAIVVEPQRNERPSPAFLESLREVASGQGAVLVFDEITSALRLNGGGVHLLHGIDPDIAVFAKGLGNGFPIAAVIGTADTMEAAQNTFISSTNWTERIGPTAALATLHKHRRLRAHEKLIHAGQFVQATWESAARESGMRTRVGHPDMPPLSHLSFEYDNARAVRTLYCQMMLEEGYLDNGAFYATCAHTEEILAGHRHAVHRTMALLAEAVRAGAVEKQLRGPVGHSGFARLTKHAP